MELHLIYMDDSRDEKLCVFSALSIPAASWQEAFSLVKEFRNQLKKSDGISPSKELHAWKFVSGRGRPSDRVITKRRRAEIFMDALRLTANLPGAGLFNAVFGAKDDKMAFERLLNRINRTMESLDSHAILICDEGKEHDYTRLARKMHVYNPIPSSFGYWEETGWFTKNIPIDRIIEDPFFKRSDQSYFIQLVDFAAYALLRRENPVASKSKYGIDKAFNMLAPILVRQATRRDPEGILRP